MLGFGSLAVMALLRRLHTWVLAWAVCWYRRRYILKQFKITHAAEITCTRPDMLPLTMARHSAELKAVRAGRVDLAAISAATNGVIQRTTWQYPFMPSSVRRVQTPMLKFTPYNLRRLSRTPVARRAINIIKGAVIALVWDVEPIEGIDADPGEQAHRIKIAKACFNHPNNDDSFQSFVETGLEDMLLLGGFVSELSLTVDPKRPFKAWPVNVESIQMMPAWTEATPDAPRYVQMTGLSGDRGSLILYDDQLLYIKDNPSTDTPYGTGKTEIAFSSLNDLLGVQTMAGRAGNDQVHKTWLWWESPQPDATMQIVRRHIQNELEGQSKISLIQGAKKPDTLDVTPVTVEDLLIPWQEFLIRMIANSYDMSAMALGIEHDVNRAVGEVLSDKDYRTAVLPIAKRLEEGFTRRILHNKLRWFDLRFRFTNLEDPDLVTLMDMCAKMYSGNAETPNGWRKRMGMKPLKTPLADLTQIEAMLLNQQASTMSQDQLADHAVARQQKQQESAPGMGMLPPGAGGPGAPQSRPSGAPGGAGSKQGGPVKPPAPLALPKFPIQGTRYTALQLASLPVNTLRTVLSRSGMRPSELLRAMDNQEPGLLSQLTDQVKEFLKAQLKEEATKGLKPLAPRLLNKWTKELSVHLRKDRARTQDLGTWRKKSAGVGVGTPGRNSTVVQKPGKL